MINIIALAFCMFMAGFDIAKDWPTLALLNAVLALLNAAIVATRLRPWSVRPHRP